MKPVDALSLNALRNWSQAEKSLIHYVYAGTVDVEVGAGIRFQTRHESKTIELGAFLGAGDVSADMWMDDALWQWRDKAAERRAQVWVKHVMVAKLLARPQGYEFEGELVLVGTTLPTRQVELLLLQTGFRPSLATWRAKTSDERRRRLPESIAWLGGDRPEPVSPGLAATKELKDIKELKDCAQHVWMRWHAIFEEELAIAGRTYQMRGRPTLGERELVIQFHHPSSGAELAFRFDVAGHPLHHKATAVFGDQTVVREGLAWEEFSEFVNIVGDAIKPRSAARKSVAASTQATAKPSTKPAATEEPAQQHGEAKAQIRELVLPPPRTSAYLARAGKAAERGDSPRRLLTEAMKESKTFMIERATNRSQALTWGEAVIWAFEQEPGWRLHIVSRGRGHTLAVYPDDGALEDTVVSIDVRETVIGDVRWLSSDLTPAQQNELLRRIQRTLKVAQDEELGKPPPSPLDDRLAEIRRRADELGIDPSVVAGGAPHGPMASAMAKLAEPLPNLAGELIGWLRATYTDHPALSLIRDWRDGDSPADLASLSRSLWDAVLEYTGAALILARGSVLRTNCEAPFTTDGKAYVLLLRPRQGGAYELFKLDVRVRPTDDADLCEIDDDGRNLRAGDQLVPVSSPRRADEHIELHRRIGEFLAEVGRTPERLQDVRRLLFWTAAMIDTPRCKGAHRAAATRAFEKAREYYDTARRSLALGVPVAASEEVHEALRRIGQAAASIAETCAEGQEPLSVRVLSEFSPRVEPSDADEKTMRAVEAAEKQAESHNATASVVHAHQMLAPAEVEARPATVTATPTPPRRSPVESIVEAREILAPAGVEVRAATATATPTPPLRSPAESIGEAREILARAGISTDLGGIRAVGRIGECRAPDPSTRDRARKALRDAGVQASIIHGRLLFSLEQT